MHFDWVSQGLQYPLHKDYCSKWFKEYSLIKECWSRWVVSKKVRAAKAQQA